MNNAFTAAQNTNSLIYCGAERCTFAEALADFGGKHVGSEGDFELIERNGQAFGMWTDGFGWVAFAI